MNSQYALPKTGFPSEQKIAKWDKVSDNEKKKYGHAKYKNGYRNVNHHHYINNDDVRDNKNDEKGQTDYNDVRDVKNVTNTTSISKTLRTRTVPPTTTTSR